ncbi:hypothetical protein KFE25_000222 [Diacronema lutheri]|uniref:Uncharacterized protein n=1 Tax=Diacronema lutheri TaxID=2081491 RepID=A0A8J5XGD5_DIALT|nr:hypothetical protein KFE25_000222 [Diacronema lutheri]
MQESYEKLRGADQAERGEAQRMKLGYIDAPLSPRRWCPPSPQRTSVFLSLSSDQRLRGKLSLTFDSDAIVEH